MNDQPRGSVEFCLHDGCPQVPIGGNVCNGNLRRKQIKYVGGVTPGEKEYGEVRQLVEHAGVGKLLFLDMRFTGRVLFHIPNPFKSERMPATASMETTMMRTEPVLTRVSSFAPILEPSIMPAMEGTAISGSMAPLNM